MIQRILISFVALLCFFSLVSATNPVGAEDSEDATQSTSKQEINKPVSEWFAKYDQIRRDCEMSMMEKLKHGNALKKALKSGGQLSTSTQAFVQKMRTKYQSAIDAMKALPTVSETKELQDGYIQYFSEMERTFAECLETQEIKAATTESKARTKENLEKINDRNKKLDDELRTKYGIPKHKHG